MASLRIAAGHAVALTIERKCKHYFACYNSPCTTQSKSCATAAPGAMSAIMAEPGTDGHLAGAHVGVSFELKLFGGDGSRQDPIIPTLIDARLISMHGDKMLFRGVEQDANGAQFVQEWSVRVTG